MKKPLLSKTLTPNLMTLVLGMSLVLGACGQQKQPDTSPYVRIEKTPIPSGAKISDDSVAEVETPGVETPSDETPPTPSPEPSVPDTAEEELETIDETLPTEGMSVWLNKKFWLGKKILVSLGVERASITGLALSVDGYHAAYLEREGDYLVLKRDNEGLFGGSVLGPEIPLNAYPIVAESGSEILVDLANPKTPFGLTLANFNYGAYADTELEPRLNYVKSVEATTSRLSFTSVSTTKSPLPLFDPEGTSAEAIAGLDPYLLAMKLRTDWILPSEDKDFVESIVDQNTIGFFLSGAKVINNGLEAVQKVQKIATHKPFVWEVSGAVPEDYKEVLEQAITTWNPSLNPEMDVLEVKFVDGMKESVTDPTVSNLVWDDNMAVGYAFANWRSNPYTGEIMQAQVYLSGSMWADSARMTYQLRKLEEQIRAQAEDVGESEPDSEERAQAIAGMKQLQSKLNSLVTEGKEALAKTSERRIGFVSFNSGLAKARARGKNYSYRAVEIERGLSMLATMAETIDEELDEALKDLDEETAAERQPDVIHSEHETPTHLPFIAADVDEDTFAKQVVRGVLMHEIGHTLGLRHNFMGSLGTSNDGNVGSASIMDYNDLVIDSQFEEPGDWDRIVMEKEYQGKLPAEGTPFMFCSDELAGTLPLCTRFDFSADPMKGNHVTEESNLLLAQILMWFGQPDMAMALLNRALMSNLDKINLVQFNAALVEQQLQDPTFRNTQVDTWKLLMNSMTMQGQEWPAELVATYKDILVSILAETTTAMTAGSAVAGEMVAFFKEAAYGAESQNFETRRASVAALQQIQSPQGRRALMELRSLMETEAAQANINEMTDAEFALFTESQDVLLAIRTILEVDGYYQSSDAN